MSERSLAQVLWRMFLASVSLFWLEAAVFSQAVVSAKAGFVDYVSGDVRYRSETGWKQAIAGLQLENGFGLRTESGARAEALLNPGSFLRLDSASEVTMINDNVSEMIIQLDRGTMIVDAAALFPGEIELTVVTEAGTMRLTREGLYRFDRLREGEVAVRVYRGEAWIDGKRDGLQQLTKGERAMLRRSSDPVRKESDASEPDNFERWSESRAAQVRAATKFFAESTPAGVLQSKSLPSHTSARGWSRDGKPQPGIMQYEVFVTDEKETRFIRDLQKDDFVVTEKNGEEQEILNVDSQSATAAPRVVILVINSSIGDLSTLEHSLKAAKALIDQLDPTDEMAIVSADVKLVADFTRDKRQLRSALDGLLKRAKRGPEYIWQRQKYLSRPPGYDIFRDIKLEEQQRLKRESPFVALYNTLRDLAGDPVRHAVIIIQHDGSDWRILDDLAPEGADPEATLRIGLADICEIAVQCSCRIYTVIPANSLLNLSQAEAYRRGREMYYASERGRYAYSIGREAIQDYLENAIRGQSAAARVAAMTGGWTAFLEKRNEAPKIYDQILSDASRRYVVRYASKQRSGGTPPGEVRIEVRGHPEYVVHGDFNQRCGQSRQGSHKDATNGKLRESVAQFLHPLRYPLTSVPALLE